MIVALQPTVTPLNITPKADKADLAQLIELYVKPLSNKSVKKSKTELKDGLSELICL